MLVVSISIVSPGKQPVRSRSTTEQVAEPLIDLAVKVLNYPIAAAE